MAASLAEEVRQAEEGANPCRREEADGSLRPGTQVAGGRSGDLAGERGDGEIWP